jgi:hypothetical protein
VRPAKPTCPSSRPEIARSAVIGIVGEDQGKRQVTFLPDPIPVTPEIRGLDDTSRPARLTEFLRFAAPCARTACVHFAEESCQLARRIVEEAPAVSDALPDCAIRPTCRWHRQEGAAACLRCPGIVTDTFA